MMMRPRSGSNVMPANERPAGSVEEHGMALQTRVQMEPSPSQVSFGLEFPPQSTTRLRMASNAIAAPRRADGLVVLQGVVVQACVQTSPLNSHVSPRSAESLPPKITMRLRVESYAAPAPQRPGGAPVE